MELLRRQVLTDYLIEEDLISLDKILDIDNINDKIVGRHGRSGIDKYRPLDYALENRSYESIIYLLKRGANYDHLINSDKTPKMELSRVYNGEVLKFFHNAGVNFNLIYDVDSEKMNLLTRSVRYGDLDLVKTILDLNLNLIDDGHNVYNQAILCGILCYEKIITLIRAGISYTKKDEELINIVVNTTSITEFQKVKLLKLMVAEGCCLNLESQYSYMSEPANTLLGYAIKGDMRHVVTQLVHMGADVTDYKSEVSELIFINKRRINSNYSYTRNSQKETNMFEVNS